MSGPLSNPAKRDKVRFRPSGFERQIYRLRRYGPGFLIEIVIFWVMLEAFEQLNYGGRILATAQSRTATILSILFVVLALGAAEARFGLYRRIWQVAGIYDAIATA